MFMSTGNGKFVGAVAIDRWTEYMELAGGELHLGPIFARFWRLPAGVVETPWW